MFVYEPDTEQPAVAQFKPGFTCANKTPLNEKNSANAMLKNCLITN
jgi:hypothetical protein